jgi:hypothetical protein
LQERIASITKVTRIGKLGTMLAAINPSTLPILATLMMVAIGTSETYGSCKIHMP